MTKPNSRVATSTNSSKYDIVMSMKPVYANLIIKGYKKFEFRKRRFSKPVDRILIYATKPVGMIIGYFTFDVIIEDTPEKIWENCSVFAGISSKDFFNYYRQADKAFALKIKEVVKYPNSLLLSNFTKRLKAPQSFFYVEAANI